MAAITEKKDLKVHGMTCQNCVSHVTKAIQTIEGVKKVSVDLKAGKATVEYDATKATPLKMAAAVQKAGYTLEF
ncbi:MAG: heavy-metal-associated domain-containing protein [Dehalococcoidia bacterium]|nr:heavy-metal-associated domain-containing protein [Dehalococcoidia bacterium]